MHGKIAFEEHYNLPQFEIPEYASRHHFTTRDQARKIIVAW